VPPAKHNSAMDKVIGLICLHAQHHFITRRAFLSTTTSTIHYHELTFDLYVPVLFNDNRQFVLELYGFPTSCVMLSVVTGFVAETALGLFFIC